MRFLPGTWYLVGYMVPGTWYVVSRYLAPGTGYLVPGTTQDKNFISKNEIPRTLVPDTWHLVPGSRYLVPGSSGVEGGMVGRRWMDAE